MFVIVLGYLIFIKCMKNAKFLFEVLILLFVLTSCKQKAYIKEEGKIFGTTYHLIYEVEEGSLHKNILTELQKFSDALNVYDTTSLISKVNRNVTNNIDNKFFIECFSRAEQISDITNGCFDITIAPVVNAWGFGFKNYKNINDRFIDSLMQFIGYKSVKIEGNSIVKQHKQTMLDVSAIAKGYGVDVVAEYLEQQGVSNYMVEIGGEVRVMGVNPNGELWRIGIDKPLDNPSPNVRELQTVINLKNKSLATSGNYRQFYKKDGVKYSHTINPKTGYPAQNSLLSASVLADDCLTADAFATAFMVMGVQKSKALAETIPNLDIYLIYEDSAKQMQTYYSKGFEGLIEE